MVVCPRPFMHSGRGRRDSFDVTNELETPVVAGAGADPAFTAALLARGANLRAGSFCRRIVVALGTQNAMWHWRCHERAEVFGSARDEVNHYPCLSHPRFGRSTPSGQNGSTCLDRAPSGCTVRRWGPALFESYSTTPRRERASVEQAFGVTEFNEEGLIRVAVSGEVDVATAPVLREHLYEAVDRSTGPVIVDLLAVTFIDSTALGVLIGSLERGKGHGSDLRIVLKEPRLIKIFEITGLTELFSLFPSIAEAVAG